MNLVYLFNVLQKARYPTSVVITILSNSELD